MSKRKAIPDRVKLHAALRRLGLKIEQVNFDHDPPLALRPVDPDTGDTIPPANDPDHIFLVTIDEHREKTFGKGGAKRATTAGSDIHRIAKTKRLERARSERESAAEDFRRRLLAREHDEPKPTPQRKSTWPTRPFPSRKKPKVRHDGEC
ncbi:hypothetical protein [Kaistia sp. MMO-174]|uniref:hypothetical protein n=1 Tax=Kaistia sp. MMO-174 TaxID=3081256 RepID=UPI003018C104